MAYRILVPWPGIKPISPALKGRFLTTFLPGKSLNNLLLPLYTLSILKFSKLFHTIYIYMYMYMYMYMCIYIYTHTSEKAMVPYSSTLAWKIPWTEEPGGLQYMGSLRVGHDWATSLSLSCTGEGNGNPLQCSCLDNPRDGRAWWAAINRVTQSWTRLQRLSSSSIYIHTYRVG